MSRNASRYGGRYREPRSRPAVARWEWWHWGRRVVVVEVTGRGVVRVTCPKPERVGGGERRLCCEWLEEHLPKLSADERHQLLWG